MIEDGIRRRLGKVMKDGVRVRVRKVMKEIGRRTALGGE